MAEIINRTSNKGRRRMWAASGCMPPEIGCLFPDGERAAMSAIAFLWAKHGTCSASIAEIGALAGVGSTTVKRALRAANADQASFVTIEDRGGLGLTNVVRIAAPDWLEWLAAGEWFGPADFRKPW